MGDFGTIHLKDFNSCFFNIKIDYISSLLPDATIAPGPYHHDKYKVPVRPDAITAEIQ